MCCICRFKEIASKSKDELVSLGFPQFTIEDFHDTVCYFSHYIVYLIECMIVS